MASERERNETQGNATQNTTHEKTDGAQGISKSEFGGEYLKNVRGNNRKYKQP